MYGVLLIVLMALSIIFLVPIFTREKPKVERSAKYNAQMKKLWTIAQTSMKERKPLRAEKALLTILKFDEKNAAAYNRLGILYAKERKFEDAIECFEIAQSLDSNPSSLHNAGLIYLETGAYEKAAMAFEQAIELEGDVPSRFIALAKAQEKMGATRKALNALESAYELDKSTTTLRQIMAIYEQSGDTEAAMATSARIEAQLAEDARVRRPASRRIVARPMKKISGSASGAAHSAGRMKK